MAEAQSEDEVPDEDAPEAEAPDEEAPAEDQGSQEAADDAEPDEASEEDGSEEEAEEGLSEDERLRERLKTEAIQQVVDVGFPMTRAAALKHAGHRRVEVGDTTLTVNMILSHLRGDDWRTGLDFQDAIEGAWDDIKDAYM